MTKVIFIREEGHLKKDDIRFLGIILNSNTNEFKYYYGVSYEAFHSLSQLHSIELYTTHIYTGNVLVFLRETPLCDFNIFFKGFKII